MEKKTTIKIVFGTLGVLGLASGIYFYFRKRASKNDNTVRTPDGNVLIDKDKWKEAVIKETQVKKAPVISNWIKPTNAHIEKDKIVALGLNTSYFVPKTPVNPTIKDKLSKFNLSDKNLKLVMSDYAIADKIGDLYEDGIKPEMIIEIIKELGFKMTLNEINLITALRN